ncbi:BQ2448_4233 [Microbotryum intermedium]|uniref:BQ2448_4233 protein n=1 Tax=Microbotryum intermedium TaxID=269621 RepID=A0A238FNN4_9BASI|nr:BQ2448_4233 [Microbotryum intermedium]
MINDSESDNCGTKSRLPSTAYSKSRRSPGESQPRYPLTSASRDPSLLDRAVGGFETDWCKLRESSVASVCLRIPPAGWMTSYSTPNAARRKLRTIAILTT